MCLVNKYGSSKAVIGTSSGTFIADVTDINTQHSSFYPDAEVSYNAADGQTFSIALMCACRGTYSSMLYGAEVNGLN